MAAPPSADMTAKHTFLEATVVRRSTIALTSESPIPDDRIIALVQHAIKHAPTPFHTQSARAVILLGAEHTKFWELAYTKCEPQFPPEVFQGKFVPNLTAFKNAHGTALFFDEPEAIDKLPPPLAGLVKNFPEWQEHANGMAQYIGMPNPFPTSINPNPLMSLCSMDRPLRRRSRRQLAALPEIPGPRFERERRRAR